MIFRGKDQERWRDAAFRWTLTAALAGVLTGCAGALTQPKAAPESAAAMAGDPVTLLAILANISTPEDSRRAADRRLVQLKGKTDESRLALLEQMLYAPGHSDTMRIYALDQLADADPGRAQRALSLYLPRFQGEVLSHACAVAAKLGDPRVTGPLVRSLARAALPNSDPASLKVRPEWAAINALSGGSALDQLYAAVQHATDVSERCDALDILQRMKPPAEVMARIRKMPGGREDSWLGDAQWWAGEFQSLPFGRDENIWIHELAQPAQARLVMSALPRHRALEKEPDYLFAPRFVFVLAASTDAAVSMSRQELLRAIHARLAARRHIPSEANRKEPSGNRNETLDGNEKKLSRCDLLTLFMLLPHLDAPHAAVIGEFERQGLDDLSDRSTEHGGLLAVENGNLVAKEYATESADSDSDYVPSDQLLRDTPAGLLQYRFHFQQIHNADRAGPAAGDLGFARNARCNALVVTSTDTHKMDIAFCTPDGAVVDLGIYQAVP